jgi:hypothetical protein
MSLQSGNVWQGPTMSASASPGSFFEKNSGVLHPQHRCEGSVFCWRRVPNILKHIGPDRDTTSSARHQPRSDVCPCLQKDEYPHQAKFSASWMPYSASGTVPPPFFHTSHDAVPIIAYRMLHAGANTQSGGVQDGFLRLRYLQM